VFLTNRPEDNQMFNELRQLSQAVIQNGGTLYEIIELYSTKSIREMKKVFKDLRDRQISQQEQAQQLEQQKLQQQQEQAQAQLQQAAQLAQEKQANEDYQKQLDRINKTEIALIAAEAKRGPLTDADESGSPDVLEINKLAMEQSKAQKDYEAKMADVNSKNMLAAQKLQVERDKNQIARENMANDLAVAKENAKGRNNKK
jgi:membrane protein involved in colicin uptake